MGAFLDMTYCKTLSRHVIARRPTADVAIWFFQGLPHQGKSQNPIVNPAKRGVEKFC